MWSSASYTTSSPTPVSPLPCRWMTVDRRVKSLETSRSSPSSSYESTSIGRSASLSKRATRGSLRDRALVLDPAADHVDHVLALLGGERTALGDLVVALEAGAAAGAGGVLGDEDGMASVRRLLAVLVRRRRRELLGDQVVRVLADRLHAAQLDGRPVAGVEVEIRAKALLLDALEAVVDLVS